MRDEGKGRREEGKGRRRSPYRKILDPPLLGLGLGLGLERKLGLLIQIRVRNVDGLLRNLHAFGVRKHH